MDYGAVVSQYTHCTFILDDVIPAYDEILLN